LARYELIFCVADEADPVIAEIRSTIAAHPQVPARILVGDDRISANPKLNNCVKGWQAARHDWIVLAESNVSMPPDYVQHLMAARRGNTGLVCSAPLGSRRTASGGSGMCLLYTSGALAICGEGRGSASRKARACCGTKPCSTRRAASPRGRRRIAWTRRRPAGRAAGLKVHMVASPFEQPLGRRSIRQMWSRQVRWARLRRVTFPGYFAPEILLGAVPPLVLGLTAATMEGASLAVAAAFVLTAVYLPELLLARAKNWHFSLLSLPAMMVRDLIMPVVWLRSWLGGPFEWRGNTMTIGTRNCELKETPAPLPGLR